MISLIWPVVGSGECLHRCAWEPAPLRADRRGAAPQYCHGGQAQDGHQCPRGQHLQVTSLRRKSNLSHMVFGKVFLFALLKVKIKMKCIFPCSFCCNPVCFGRRMEKTLLKTASRYLSRLKWCLKLICPITDFRDLGLNETNKKSYARNKQWFLYYIELNPNWLTRTKLCCPAMKHKFRNFNLTTVLGDIHFLIQSKDKRSVPSEAEVWGTAGAATG